MELIPSNLFSSDDLQILLPRLWELLGKQTERYTMGESTSVTVEAAQELFASLWYTITLAMDETHTPYSRLLSEELIPFLKQGQTILQDKLEGAKRLWEMVCRTASDIKNFYYTDTLRGIGDYLRRYDLYYFAHRKPLCIDYPLLNALSETMHGLTYTEQYLKCIYSQDVEPAIGINGCPVSIGKVFQTALSVIIPAQDGGECKEDETDHKCKRGNRWREGKSLLESIHSDLYAFQSGIPASCYDDAQTCHCTDDNCIDESTCHGNQSLSDWLLCLGCSCSDRGTSQTGFV